MNKYKIALIVFLSTNFTFAAVMDANESPRGPNRFQRVGKLTPTCLFKPDTSDEDPQPIASLEYDTHSNNSEAEELDTQTPELFNTPEMVAPPATIIEQAPVLIQQAPVVVVEPQPQAVIPVRLISIENILIRKCSGLLIHGNFVLGDIEIETLKQARNLAMHKKALISFLCAYEKRHPHLKTSLEKLVKAARNNQDSYRLETSKILEEILPQLANKTARAFFIKEMKRWEQICKKDLQTLSNCADHWHKENLVIVKTLLDREKLISNRSLLAFLNKLESRLI